MEIRGSIKRPIQSQGARINTKKYLRSKVTEVKQKLEAEKSKEYRIKQHLDNITAILSNEQYKHRNWAKQLADISKITFDQTEFQRANPDPLKVLKEMNMNIQGINQKLHESMKVLNDSIHFANKMVKNAGKNTDDISAASNLIPEILDEMFQESNHREMQQQGTLYSNPFNNTVIGEELDQFIEEPTRDDIFTNPRLNPKGFRPTGGRISSNKNPPAMMRTTHFCIYDGDATIKKKRKKDHEPINNN